MQLKSKHFLTWWLSKTKSNKSKLASLAVALRMISHIMWGFLVSNFFCVYGNTTFNDYCLFLCCTYSYINFYPDSKLFLLVCRKWSKRSWKSLHSRLLPFNAFTLKNLELVNLKTGVWWSFILNWTVYNTILRWFGQVKKVIFNI